jgi:hypothetical protein
MKALGITANSPNAADSVIARAQTFAPSGNLICGSLKTIVSLNKHLWV